jgi:transposase
MDHHQQDPERLRRLYIDERRTVGEVAEVLGVARSTAHNWLRAAGIDLRPSPSKRRDDISDDRLRELYVGDQLSAPDIAQQFGCATTTVYHRLDQLGIPRRPKGCSAARPDKSELARLYIEQGLSLREIASRRGVTAPAVAGWLRHYNISARAARTPPVSVGVDAVVDGYRSGLSGLELASQHHCSTATIYRLLDQEGVPRRQHQSKLTRDDLVAALDDGYTAEQIAEMHDLSVSAVCRALRRENLMTQRQTTRQRARQRYADLVAGTATPKCFTMNHTDQ